MSSLRAKQFLSNLAYISQKERETFSREEIVKKINEIKYLSAQKKVPKLTLRKEIIHLEDKLQGVIELEKKLIREKNKESVKVNSLKQQINTLKNKLEVSENKELSKKVEKLSHLLGEHLAKKETSKEIALSGKVLKESRAEQAKSIEVKVKKLDSETIKKANTLRERLEALKHELAIHTELETKSSEELEIIKSKIEFINEKLNDFYEKHPELLVQEIGVVETEKEVPIIKEEKEVKHLMLFSPSAEISEEETTFNGEDLELEKELPLPPPPRIRKK
ncbi:MAG: hypothetical protein ABH824_00050 [Nanoarchaeota archaeon]|nr:hypothetical protein [Nanoarchaeota archaeon]MBU1631601.1 hypothetical protein [Nanoarchaeota archaeon]MBU1876027.1 hypothetical protein [Nanoarchaeota archaeon]